MNLPIGYWIFVLNRVLHNTARSDSIYWEGILFCYCLSSCEYILQKAGVGRAPLWKSHWNIPHHDIFAIRVVIPNEIWAAWLPKVSTQLLVFSPFKRQHSWCAGCARVFATCEANGVYMGVLLKQRVGCPQVIGCTGCLQKLTSWESLGNSRCRVCAQECLKYGVVLTLGQCFFQRCVVWKRQGKMGMNRRFSFQPFSLRL